MCKSACVEPLENRTLLAAAAPVPAGTIYYNDYKMVETSFGTFPTYNGVWSMQGNGSGKTQVSADPIQPSRLLHGGRWSLGIEDVAGSYPNGQQRREVFATRLDDGLKLQLTDDPAVQPEFSALNWSFNDTFTFYAAVTWEPVTSGGNYTDASGNQWLTDGGVFRATLDWSGGSPAAALPAEVLDAGVQVHQYVAGRFTFTPDISDVDWSPSGTQMVYQQSSQGTSALHVATFDATLTPIGTIRLASGTAADWSPDGSRIVYSAPSPDYPNLPAIWSVKPDASNVVRLTKTAQMSDSHPSWSPDGKFITFTRRTLPKGYKPGIASVMRMTNTGGSATNLSSGSEYAEALTWAANVQGASASSSPALSFSQFSTEPVSDAPDYHRLIDLVA